MELAEKINRVKTLLGNEVEAEDAMIEEYLSIALDDILNTRYPWGIPEEYDIGTRYDNIQCILAARYFARNGGLGETLHNENGINRAWYSSDDREILAKVTPLAKVVG